MFINRRTEFKLKRAYRIKNIFREIKFIPHILKEQTYYPEWEKKSKVHILLDNLIWLIRHKEVNKFYFAYGMDRTDKNLSFENYLPYSLFCDLRNMMNFYPIESARYNYLCLLRDKFIFGQYLRSLGIPTPENIAVCDKNNITWLIDDKKEPISQLCLMDIDVFLKDLTGECGEGVFHVYIKNGRIFINGNKFTQEQLLRKLNNGKFLVQSCISQHDIMKNIYSESINTIRLITINTGDKIQVLSAVLRIGADGNNVDNWARGGISVGLNIETGELNEYGFYKPGYYKTRTSIHPDTKIAFKGIKVPYWNETLNLARKLHGYMEYIHSVGWDIAITEKGPIFIEGNDNWEISQAQVCCGGLKNKFIDSIKM